MRIEAIDRETRSLPPIKNQTKCTKMTDESDSIIKNGINGAVASFGAGGGGGTAIHVSRGSAISSSGGVSATITVGSGATNLRMQYSSGGGSANANSLVSGTEQSNNNQEIGAVTLAGGGGGNNSADAIRSPNPGGIGGRLQFFKDGKFILELARAREGERAGWVSVPRKTFWPPSASSAATTNSNYPKNESSTSLSFSDDNSSIQSSPWQRDHCWKQTSPRRGVSKEMCMFFKRTKKISLSHDGYKTAQLKRRRPHDNSICKIPFTLVKNGLIKTEYIEHFEIKKEADVEDGENEENDKKAVEGAPTIKVEDNKQNEIRKSKCRAKLSTILEKLIDRLPTGLFYLSKVNPPSGIINHFSTTPSRITELHNHQQHVSPRKRILRELEKVSLEDNSTKRSRAKSNVTAISPLIPTSPSNAVSQVQSIAATTQRIAFQNNGSVQVANGNGTATDANSGTNSNRLNSSYSIHSLLGNSNSNSNKTESNAIQSSKDLNDPSCLRIMLTSPNSSENYYGSRSTYTSGGGGKRKSPNYCMPQDSQNHNRRSSRESPNNYGSNHPSESSLSPDPINRYKPSSNTSTSFHPYSPKYSPSTVSPNTLNDNYKQQKSGYASGSPSHQQMSSKISSTSRSSTVSSYTQQSPHSSKTSNVSSNSRMREQSPGENLSPSSTDRRDGTPRTVPKKTVAFRQQFSSPTSSPNIAQNDSSSSVYKSPSEQKRKPIDERTLSPENKMYHSSLEMEQHRTGASMIRASPVMPPSSYYYFHPPHGSPGPSSYIPPMSYYPISPYAAAVAALRNPLWMHYQTGLLPGPTPRLPFPYNGESGLGPPPPGISSMHLSSGPVTPWPSLNVQNSATDDPVSLVNVKDEHNADVPLNLSKH